MDPTSDLSTEQAAYERMRGDLVSGGLSGKWIVIVGDRQIAIRDDPQAAYADGVREVGVDRPFFLKQIGGSDESNVPTLFLELLHADR